MRKNGVKLDFHVRTVFTYIVMTFNLHPSAQIRTMMSASSKAAVVLHEVLLYLNESLESLKLPDARGSELEAVLAVPKLKEDVTARAVDLRKLVLGLKQELTNLQQVQILGWITSKIHNK